MESLKTSDSIDQIALALSKAQGSMQPAPKSGAVKYKNIDFKYSTLDDLKEVSKKPLYDNELAIIQPVSRQGNLVVVITRLMHSSGQWLESQLSMCSIDEKPQSIGSVTTYAKRYSYAAMLNIPDCDDDDGQAGAGIVTQKDANIYDQNNNGHKQLLVSTAKKAGINDLDLCKTMSLEAARSKIKIEDIESFVVWYTEHHQA